MNEYKFAIYGVGFNYKEAWENALEQANQFSEASKPEKIYKIKDSDWRSDIKTRRKK